MFSYSSLLVQFYITASCSAQLPIFLYINNFVYLQFFKTIVLYIYSSVNLQFCKSTVLYIYSSVYLQFCISTVLYICSSVYLQFRITKVFFQQLFFFRKQILLYLHEFHKCLFPFPCSRQICHNWFIQALTVKIFQQNCDCCGAGVWKQKCNLKKIPFFLRFGLVLCHPFLPVL